MRRFCRRRVKSRKRRAPAHGRGRLSIEPLEDRRLLAPTVLEEGPEFGNTQGTATPLSWEPQYEISGWIQTQDVDFFAIEVSRGMQISADVEPEEWSFSFGVPLGYGTPYYTYTPSLQVDYCVYDWDPTDQESTDWPSDTDLHVDVTKDDWGQGASTRCWASGDFSTNLNVAEGRADAVWDLAAGVELSAPNGGYLSAYMRAEWSLCSMSSGPNITHSNYSGTFISSCTGTRREYDSITGVTSSSTSSFNVLGYKQLIATRWPVQVPFELFWRDFDLHGSWTFLKDEFDPWVAIFKPTGELASPPSTGQVSVVADQTGTWYVAVSRNDQFDGGPEEDNPSKCRPYVLDLEWEPPLELESFSHATNSSTGAVQPDTLALKYNGGAAEAFDVGFFTSSDGVFDENEDTEFYRIQVSPDSLRENSSVLIGLLDDKGQPEDPDAALTPGEHTLLIDPTGTGLESALEYSDAEIILAVVDPEAEGSTVPFRGFYHGQPGRRAVVRTGPGMKDQVTVDSGSMVLEYTSEDDEGETETETATVASPADLLIVTSNRDDLIAVDADCTTDVIVKAGRGDDLVVGGSGNDELDGGEGEDVLLGEGLGLQLTSLETFLENLRDKRIKFDAALACVGSGNDTLRGGDGFDVLLGGPGSDKLLGGDGGAMIFGDAFKVTAGIDVDFAPFFTSSSVQNLKDNLYRALDFHAGVTLDGSGADTIEGGSGFDLILGGAGGDDVKTGSGFADLVFGNDGNDEIDGSEAGFLIAFGGDHGDNLTGASQGSFLVGGQGSDTLTGGDGVDVLLGDGFNLQPAEFSGFLETLSSKKVAADLPIVPEGDGDDSLTGSAGFDVLIGGLGTDTLDGGSGGGVLFGDAFTVKMEASFDFGAFFEGGNEESAKSGLGKVFELLEAGAQIELTGEGNDQITGGSGFDFVIGGAGDDTVKGAGGLADVAFGNDGNDTLEADGTNFTILFGGGQNDSLVGGSTRNYLVGGAGNDTLAGGDGVDVLIGDGFKFKLNDQEEVVDGFVDFLKGLDEREISFKLTVEATGTGEDQLTGGAGFDVLIGGDGQDTLDGGSGGGLLFGDSFDLEAGPENLSFKEIFDDSDDSGNPKDDDEATKNKKKSKAKKLWTKALALIGAPEFTLKGSGDDKIDGGSGVDLIVGGKGHDTGVGGGGFVDVLLGNEGNDTLKGHTTFLSLMIGGEGNDTLEAATIEGSLGSILIGDTFDFLGVPLNVASLFTIEFDDLLPIKFGVQTLFTQSGDGTDKLTGAVDGLNLMVGGYGSDTLTGGGFFDLMLGDAFNPGVDVSIDFSGISISKDLEENLEAIQAKFELPGLAGNGADKIDAGDGFTVALGGGGVDTITGGSGKADVLIGNEGNDVINGSSGFNVLIGGEDDDQLRGGNDGNVILGDTLQLESGQLLKISALKNGRFEREEGIGLRAYGNGQDTLVGGDGLDVLIGGDGDDTIYGHDGFNVGLGDAFQVMSTDFNFSHKFSAALKSMILADPSPLLEELFATFGFVGSGEDRYFGGANQDIVYGGGGADVLSGAGGWDFLVGGPGNDIVDGGQGAVALGDEGDVVLGGLGDDELYGGGGGDHLESEEGEDVFFGGPGDDSISGGIGNDSLFGGDGNDQLHGEGDDDLLQGGDGEDSLFGAGGNDHLVGGPGSDLLDGGGDDDLLSGGTGDSLLDGGSGNNQVLNVSARTDMTLVVDPTPTDTGGEVPTLHDGCRWIDEWDPFWVEIWISTPDADDTGVSGATVDLTYNADFFTAASIEYGPAFAGNLTGSIGDDAGRVDGIGATTSRADVGDDTFALLARVRFEPTVDDDVPCDAAGQYITPLDKPYELGLRLENVAISLVGVGAVGTDLGALPSLELWPVIYDVDDDGQVGFGDLAFFATAFQQTVGDPGADFAWACDFDHSERVDVGDLAFFAENFQRTPGSPMVYPGNFPDDWQNGTQGAAGMQELAAAENPQAAGPASLHDSALKAYPDRLEAGASAARLPNDLLGYACCLWDFDPIRAASRDTKDAADAVDLLLANGYW